MWTPEQWKLIQTWVYWAQWYRAIGDFDIACLYEARVQAIAQICTVSDLP